MPKNNNLEPVGVPVEIYGREPKTEFANNLESIKITLVDGPTMDDLRNYLVPFVLATWTESPIRDTQHLTQLQRDHHIRETIFGKRLPTALETVGVTFLIEGISIQEATHILRYRTASFGAETSDKNWNDHRALVPNSIQNSDEFYERYQKICKEAMQLYTDMIESRKVPLLDARYIMPRCMETFYYMRMNLKDWFHFIRQRIDRNIQPETDNVIAYKIYIELLKRYPVIHGLIDIDEVARFWAGFARSGIATNLYFPDEQNDTFEWHEDDFVHKCRREEMNGTNEGATNKFIEFLEWARAEIKHLYNENKDYLEKLDSMRGKRVL